MKLLFLISLLFILFSCGENKSHDHAGERGEEENTTEVQLSETQLRASGVVTGSARRMQLSEELRVSGVLDVPPQNLVSISAPLGGFVRSTELLQGMPIRKGQVLAELEHQDYIQLQQDYLDTRERYGIAEKELERQQALRSEQINAEKVFQQAGSEARQLKIRLSALSERLQLAGIDPETLARSGNISRKIQLRSPVNGFVKAVNTNIGKYAGPQDVLFELVDKEHLHVELAVFEKDAALVREGQQIRFTLPGKDTGERTAQVYLVGKALNADRTIPVHGHIDNDTDPALIPGLFVSAVIETAPDSVWAVPEAAIVYHEGKPGLFEEESAGHYRFIPVQPGKKAGGWIALPESIQPEKLRIVLQGAHVVLSGMVGGGEHHH